MIDFLLKSTLSLFVLYAVYVLLLEGEKMHQFNRFYLLCSLLFSMVIPFVTFEIYVETTTSVIESTAEYLPIATTIVEEESNYLPIVLWCLYIIITIALTIRFVRNLNVIRQKINSNSSTKVDNTTLILLNEKVLPHTFLNYIFMNKEDYENKTIEGELFTHELTHVNQKHSLDILLVEILKIIFWFNPLFIFYKKAIQLNHEFLADEKVVTSYNNVPFYQNLLLEKASWNNNFYLASNLNFLVTKKRLIMMTKTTSKHLMLLKKATVIPVIVGMMYFLCTETAAQTKSPQNNQKVIQIAPVNERDYFKNVRFKYYEDSYKDKDGIRRGKLTVNKMYEELTEADKEKFQFSLIVPPAIQKKPPTAPEFNDFKNKKMYAVWVDNKFVDNSELSKYKSEDFASFSGSAILKNARTKKHPQPFQFWLYTNSYFDKNQMGKQKVKYDGSEIVLWGVATSNTKPVKEVTTQVKETNEEAETVEIAELAGDIVYNSVEKRPEFPGGMQKFLEFVGQNYQAPKTDVKGRVYVQFVVEADGSLTNIETMRDIGHGTGEEAVRVLKLSPKWIPGEVNGKPVRVLYSLPISIVGN